MLEILLASVSEILLLVVVALVGYATKEVKQYLNKKGVLTEMKNHKELVGHVVKAVEQGYKDFSGAEKLEMAKIKVVALAQEKGLNITEREIDTLIEACVNELKKEMKN